MKINYTDNDLYQLKKFLIKAHSLKPPYNQEAYVAIEYKSAKAIYTWSEIIETITKELQFYKHEYIIHTFCQHVCYEDVPLYLNNSILKPYVK